MKTKILFLTAACLFTLTGLRAQWGNSYQVATSRNNQGFVIENFVTTGGIPGYITACTSYNNGAAGSVTSGIRITAVTNAGAVVWDRRFYNNNTEIRVFDIYRQAATNRYVVVGYTRTGGLNRAFVLQFSAAGAVITTRFLPIVSPNFGAASSWVHGISITEFNGTGYAVTGFITNQLPTAAASATQRNECFLALVDYNLNYINTTLFAHNSMVGNNRGDVPLHITDVPGVGLHITGGCESNLPGRAEAVLNIMFDYNANLLWENSFMDLNTEDVEIGQFSYYDNIYGVLYLMSYKYNSRTVAVYAIDPASGAVISALTLFDPNQVIQNLYGLTLTKDDINSPDNLYITGYVISSMNFPQTNVFGYPVFSTSIFIPDLIGGTANTTNLFVYDIQMPNYGSFNFASNNNMLGSNNTILRIPTNLGFATQMAVADQDRIVISSPRFSNLFGQWHPTITQHTTYFNDACYAYSQVYKYDLSNWGPVPPAILFPSQYATVNLPCVVLNLAPNVYPCSAFFIQAPDNLQQTNNEEENTTFTLGEEELLTGYRFYPTLVNQSSAELYLEMPQDKDRAIEVSIYDMSGRLLHQYNSSVFAGQNQTLIRAENLAPGVNIVYIQGLDKPVVQKVVRN